MVLSRRGAALALLASCLLLSVPRPAAGVAPSRATPDLVSALESEGWAARRDALQGLSAQALRDRRTADAVLSALEDEDCRVRREAVAALDRGERRSRRSLAAIARLLDDHDGLVRERAARALGHAGRRARPHAARLIERSGDPHPRVRASAVSALGPIGLRPGQQADLAAIVLGDEEPAVRRAVAATFAGFGERWLPELTPLLGDEDEGVRRSTAEALARLGCDALPALLSALGSGDPLALDGALLAFEALGGEGRPALEALAREPSEPPLKREHALLALARLAPVDEEALHALTLALDDAHPAVRQGAARGLGEAGAAAASAVPALAARLADPREDLLVRRRAALALGRCAAPADPSARSALLAVVGAEQPVLHEAAVEALAALEGRRSAGGPRAAELAALVESLASRSTTDRLAAAEELGRLGARAAAAVEPLARTLASEDEDPRVRAAAARALGLVGGAAHPAVRTLAACLDAESPALRLAALEALQRIGPPPPATLPHLMAQLRAEEPAARQAAALEMRAFSEARLQAWLPVLERSSAPVIRSWLARHEALYGARGWEERAGEAGPQPPTAGLFDLLGGRAAVRETLRRERIGGPAGSAADRILPVYGIQGVEVASHPFEEWVEEGALTGEPSPLMRLVPQDRLVVHLPRPRALAALLEEGFELPTRLRALLTGAAVDHRLGARYLRALALDTARLRALLTSPGLVEAAVLLPDAFVVDGTDVTLLLRGRDARAAESLLGQLGREVPESGEVAEARAPNGRQVHWARRDDVAMLSTSRGELERSLLLHARAGRESLGAGAELRYLLARLPVGERTIAHAYLSDPFLRRQVGPAVKIAQERRLRARADAELVTAGALLHQLDGHAGLPTIERLVRLGYVPAHLDLDGVELQPDLRVVSERHGSLSEPKALGANPVERVTPAERDAYRRYRESYGTVWSEYFDPIALRLDAVDDRTLELSTFVLPLADDTVYGLVRDVLPRAEHRVPLATPVLDPPPVILASVNLGDAARLELAALLISAVARPETVDPSVFDALGPGVHLAVHDSSPIVAVGAGDLLRALDAGLLDLEGGLPLLLSLLTQPCQVLIELQDPGAVRSLLDRAGTLHLPAEPRAELSQVRRGERWQLDVELLDLLRLSLGIAIQGRWLVLENLPWQEGGSVVAERRAPLNGARLEWNLDAVRQLLPALHAASSVDDRAQALEGAGHLLPLLLSSHAGSADEALRNHFELFGFLPVHPRGGHWRWEGGELVSSLFGTAARPLQPPHAPEDADFGLVRGVEQVVVDAQLEDDGLRATVRWRTSRPLELPPPPPVTAPPVLVGAATR
jgi:HEAT repeat protein